MKTLFLKTPASLHVPRAANYLINREIKKNPAINELSEVAKKEFIRGIIPLIDGIDSKAKAAAIQRADIELVNALVRVGYAHQQSLKGRTFAIDLSYPGEFLKAADIAKNLPGADSSVGRYMQKFREVFALRDNPSKHAIRQLFGVDSVKYIDYKRASKL